MTTVKLAAKLSVVKTQAKAERYLHPESMAPIVIPHMIHMHCVSENLVGRKPGFREGLF